MTLVEIKSLGTINGKTVQQRADTINRDYARHAEAIDAKLPGSKVLDELKNYGVDGKVLALVTGSLGNCSSDLLVMIDFIAATKTARALELRIANRDQLFSMHRRFLISSFGLFTTRLWARHIHDRFRDAVSAQALPPVPTGSRTPIARSPGNFTWETLIRAARSTAAPAAALKRAMTCHFPLPL